MATELLRKGASGIDVKQVQNALNFHLAAKLAPIRADSMFGPVTEGRVQEFQRRNRLTADGVVGPITRAKLFALALARVRVRLRRTRGMARTAARTLVQRDGEPTTQSKQLIVDWGQTFSFHPLADPAEGEHLFRTEMKLALKNSGDDEGILGRLTLDAVPATPTSSDWEFSAELEMPVVELPTFGPLRGSLFLTPGFQLNPLAAGIGAGLKLGVAAVGDRIGIFAQGDLKAQYDPGTGQGEMTPSGSGVVEVKF